jgi:hypothetical protein
VAAALVDAALVAAGPMAAAVDRVANPVAAAPVDAALVAAGTMKGAAPMDPAASFAAAAPMAAAAPVAAAPAATIVAAASPLVAATNVLAAEHAEHAAPAAAWSTEGLFFLLEAQTSRLCLSSLLLLLLGCFLALRREVGAAVGLLLQQRLISSSPSRDSSCTRTHNPSAAQALYTAKMRASGLKGGAAWCGVGLSYTLPRHISP